MYFSPSVTNTVIVSSTYVGGYTVLVVHCSYLVTFLISCLTYVNQCFVFLEEKKKESGGIHELE
jgi:hypothetical protein